MKLCHPEEQASCSQYSATKDRKIEIVKIAKDATFQTFSEQTQMVFIIKGSVNILSKKVYNKNAKAGELILIPLHRNCAMTALKDVTMMIMTLDFNIIFCERMPLELLLETQGKNKEDAGVGLLKSHQKIADFIHSINDEHLSDELKCSYYYDLKIREMLFLIWAYYDKKQVFNFFKPIYNSDFSFSSSVFKHLNEVKTVGDLAVKLDYSLSGFEKKFRRIFETSPYQWMQEQRAKKIHKEIICTRKTFTVIAKEYDFSSPAHFNDFCKQYFNNTPGGLRKENTGRASN